mgnify:CR=1 FL=1
MSRPRGRRGSAPLGRSRADGRWLAQGRQACDDISGLTFPVRDMTRDACGNLVSRYERDGSYDRAGGVWGPPGCEPPAKGRTLVYVEATDAVADTSGATGTFTIFRAGDASAPMTIHYGVTGTGVAGTHYQALSGTAVFTAGQSFATVTVTPVVGSFMSGTKTVVLTIVANPLQVYAIPLPVPIRPTSGLSTALATIPDVHQDYTPPDQVDPSSSPCGYNAPAARSATATVTISVGAGMGAVALLLRYEFNPSPGLLVNSGTLGTSFNLSQSEICLGEG